jgi:hypothetical protein
MSKNTIPAVEQAPAKNVVVVVPATAPEVPATAPEVDKLDDVMSEAELLAIKAEKAKQREDARRQAISVQITDMELALSTALARKKRYESDDVDVVASAEFLREARPNVWEAIQTDPDKFAAELKDLRMSLLSPKAREYKSKLEDLTAQIAKLTADRSTVLADALAEFPDDFGDAVKAPKAPKAPKDPNAPIASGSDKPFTGTMRTVDEDTASVKSYVASGITSETEMIRRIYGNDFAISGSKPRFQIHAIREKLGLIATKA